VVAAEPVLLVQVRPVMRVTTTRLATVDRELLPVSRDLVVPMAVVAVVRVVTETTRQIRAPLQEAASMVVVPVELRR
jgi:hypothetical protein